MGGAGTQACRAPGRTTPSIGPTSLHPSGPRPTLQRFLPRVSPLWIGSSRSAPANRPGRSAARLLRSSRQTAGSAMSFGRKATRWPTPRFRMGPTPRKPGRSAYPPPLRPSRDRRRDRRRQDRPVNTLPPVPSGPRVRRRAGGGGAWAHRQVAARRSPPQAAPTGNAGFTAARGVSQR